MALDGGKALGRLGGEAVAAFQSATRAGNTRGIVFMVLATVVFVIGDMLMKLSAARLPTGEAMFVRGLLALPMVWLYAFKSGAVKQWRQHLSWRLGLRTSAEVGASLSFQSGLVRLPFADVSAIVQVNPLVVTAGAALFLGEKVGWRRWTATLFGLMGVLLIVKPGSPSFQWASLFIIAATVFSMTRDLATRTLPTAVPTGLVIACSVTAVTCASLVFLPFETWVRPTRGDLGILFLAAATTIIGQMLVVLSIRSGEVSAVAPFRYCGIIWALAVSAWVWQEFPDRLTMLGITIVVAAGLYTFHREHTLRRRAEAARIREAAP